MADIPYLAVAKLICLPQAGQMDEAKRLAETVVAKATERGDPIALRKVCGIVLSGPGRQNKELMALAVKAAEAMVQVLGDKDALALLDMATVYFEADNKAKAKEYARKAVEAAAQDPNPKKRAAIEQQAAKLTGEKK